MIPMLRTLARSTPVLVATCRCPCSLSFGNSPAVVSERLVRLGHLVSVLTALHARAQAVARVEQFVHQPLGHGLLAAGPCVLHDPAKREGGAARGAHLDRDLVGRATDSAAADLQRRLDVVESTLQRDDRVIARLLPATLQRAVDDTLGQLPLAIPQHPVCEPGDGRGSGYRI